RGFCTANKKIAASILKNCEKTYEYTLHQPLCGLAETWDGVSAVLSRPRMAQGRPPSTHRGRLIFTRPKQTTAVFGLAIARNHRRCRVSVVEDTPLPLQRGFTLLEHAVVLFPAFLALGTCAGRNEARPRDLIL